MDGDKFEVFAILGGQGRNRQLGVGKVQALFRLELVAFLIAAGDAGDQHALLGPFDFRLDLAIVDRHPVAGPRAGQSLNQSAFDRESRILLVRPAQFAGRHQSKTFARVNPLFVTRRADVAGAYFRASQIHEYPHAPSGPVASGAHMLNHPRPMVGVVMGAIDADRLDAPFGQTQHELRIVGGLRRASDQQGHRAALPGLAEQGAGAGGEQGFAVKKRFLGRTDLARLVGQSGERGAHRQQTRQNPAFEPPERRQAQRHQAALRLAQIEAPQSQIGREIFGAGREVGAD